MSARSSRYDRECEARGRLLNEDGTRRWPRMSAVEMRHHRAFCLTPSAVWALRKPLPAEPEVGDD